MHYYDYEADCEVQTRLDQIEAELGGRLAGRNSHPHPHPHHPEQNPDTYPLARFISEHGFQSFPSFRSYHAVTAAEDWSRDSELLAYRQRHPDGNAQALEREAH